MHLHSRIYKLASSICLLLSAASLLMIARSPATGYEVSIYTTNLSPLVWVLLISSMGGSIFLLVAEALGQQSEESKRWLIPLFTLTFSSLIVLLLPILKGYFLSSRGDGLEHVGHIQDILLLGHFSSHNIYPAQHILPAIVAQVSRLSAQTVAGFVSPFYSLGYVLFVYLLAKPLFLKKSELILACTSGAILLIPHNGLLEASRPAAQLFPLALALLLRSQKNKSFDYKLPLVLVLVLNPFLHPLATLVMALTLGLVILVQFKYNANGKREPRQETHLNFFFILLVVSFLWYSDLFIFRVGVDFLLQLLNLETTASPVYQTSLLLAKGGVQGFGVIRLLLKFYGGEIIYGLLASLATFTIVRKLFSHQRQTREVVTLGVLFLTLCLAYFFFWTGMVFGYGETYSRLVFYIPVVSIILASPILGQIGYHPWYYRKLGTVLVSGLILISATLSIFNKYPSPYLHNPNTQVTYMEIEGTEWIVSHRDYSIKLTYTGTSLFSFAVAKHGAWWFYSSRYPFDPTYPYPPVPIPNHFGYDRNETIGASVNESAYLVLTKFDWVLYEEVWKAPIPTRWGKTDFARLEPDPTADKLYTNGEFEVWYLQPVGPSPPGT